MINWHKIIITPDGIQIYFVLWCKNLVSSATLIVNVRSFVQFFRALNKMCSIKIEYLNSKKK